MWTYLKDFALGKLLSKFIEAEPQSLEPNSPYFQLYKNIKLNPESAENLLSDYKFVEGSAEELSVEVDWMELLKYWTEIKSKYHIESDGEDEDSDKIDIFSVNKCSEVNIKNLILRIETQSSSPVTESVKDVDVDLLNDFLNHVISQFKVRIDGITLIINDQITLKCKEPITIYSEINGVRRIQLPEIRLEATDNAVNVKKGSEISITRNIEGFQVKIQIPEITIELEDLEYIMKLNILSTSESKDSVQSTSFGLSCDLVIIKFKEMKVLINDIYFNESGEFITGHFNIKWKGLMLLNSPVQTQVIRGNFMESRMEMDDELEITIESFGLIGEIMKLYNGGSNGSGQDYKNIKLRALNVRIEGYQVQIDELTAQGNQINVKAIDLIYQNSQIQLQGITYTRSDALNAVNISTSCSFAELKRFIENDEIFSLEKKDILYSCFTDSNRLSIQKAKGRISITDLTSTMSVNTSANTSNTTSVIGIVDEVDFEIVLNESCDSVYRLQLASFEFLKASDSFFDFRSNLKNLMRNDKILLESGQVNCTTRERVCVVEIESLAARVPYNLVDLLKLDMNQLKYKEESMGSKEYELQLVLRNSSFDLEGPEPIDKNEHVKSQFKVKEFTLKMDTAKSITIYLDDFQMELDDCPVFNSGLLKISVDTALTVRNHCSNVTLTPESFEKLKRFVKYWTEILSPIIQEIAPEAIYFSERKDESARLNECDYSAIVNESTSNDTDNDTKDDTIRETVTFYEDGEDNLELELDILYEEDLHNTALDSYTELSSLKLYEPVEEKQQDLKELLNEIDEEFFVNKKKIENCRSQDKCIEIIDFGVEITLILPETEIENEFKISLKGIDGTISSDSIELKVNDGGLFKKSSVILGRWQKGPDVTCKYPIEDGNFLRIQAEKIGKSQKGIDEFNLIISICPLRLFLDQKSLNSLCNFGNVQSSDYGADGMIRGFIFFNKVNISALALKLDYNPNASSLSSPAIPLQGAEMILPRIELRGIKGLEGLGPAIVSAWIPELKGSKLTGVLKTGLVPVRTVVNLGGGMVELILLPWQLGSRDIGAGGHSSGSAAQTVAHIRRSSKQIGLETLKLTTCLANQTSKLLGSTQQGARGYPKDFQSGVQQAAQLIIALPTRIHQQSQRKSALRVVPLLILDSAATATGALAKTLQGIQAEFDRETGIERKLKKQG